MTAPPDSPATRTQSQTISKQLLNTRKNLVKSKFYLGHKSVFDNVHWVRDGRAHRLAVKPTAVIEHDHNSDSPQTYPSPPPDGDFDMAHLSAIVQIDNNDFWLTLDAGYRKPSAIWQGLASVKPSCAATEPHVQPVKDDFKTVVENLCQLQSLTSTPGYQQGKGLLLPTAVHGPRFKVRHTLFDPLSADELDEDKQSTGGEAKDSTEDGNESADDMHAFSIDNWPLTDESAQPELEELKATHQLVPIPAYDVCGKLIKPDAYRRSLANALVELHFSLSHWPIGGKRGVPGYDVYTAEIQMIHVIAPPRATVTSTPRKRKISLYVDQSPSPSKKRRT